MSDHTKMMKLSLRRFVDEVPALSEWSSSYGGQWSSKWIVVFTPSGSTRATKYVVGWSRQHDPVTEEAKLRGSVGAIPWKYSNPESAWCYRDEIRELFLPPATETPR